jgi:pyruvate,water dikinase
MNALGDLFREFGMSAESLETVLLGDKAGMPAFRPGLRTLKHTGRIIRFIWRKLHFEPFLIMEYALLKKKFESLRVKISNSDPVKDFGSLYDELFKEGGRLAYLNIIVPILMQIYHRNLRKKLKKAGYDYDTLNFTEDFPRLKEFSPVYSMNIIRDDFERLPDEIKIKCNSFSALKEVPEAKELLIKIEDFISSFGHHSSSGNDFSYKKWEEEPELVFSMIINSQPGKSQEERPDFSSLRQSGLRKRKLGKAYMKAGKFLLYREMISSLYIFGYGQFRLLFLRTGKELVKNGITDDSEDIFYFTGEELIRILEELNKNNIIGGKELVLSRKREMADCENMAMPSVIYGDYAPLPETGNIKNLKGTGTSPGTCRGNTKIVRGTWDFSSVNQGEIIIIPFSDVSWSPVLLKAGAIVSESGGMLSHCSIIAREMGIPAMVSVDNVCQLQNGIEVTVDGSNGILTIH